MYYYQRAAKKIAHSDTFEDDAYEPAFEAVIAKVNRVGYGPLGFLQPKIIFFEGYL